MIEAHLKQDGPLTCTMLMRTPAAKRSNSKATPSKPVQTPKGTGSDDHGDIGEAVKIAYRCAAGGRVHDLEQRSRASMKILMCKDHRAML